MSSISQAIVCVLLLLTYIAARLGQAEFASAPLEPGKINQVVNGGIADFASTPCAQEVCDTGKLESQRVLPSA